jgi:hypothetical protein
VGGGPLGGLDVDRDAWQRAVLAAMVEMEVRVRDGDDVVELDADRVEEPAAGTRGSPSMSGSLNLIPVSKTTTLSGWTIAKASTIPDRPASGPSGCNEVGDEEWLDPTQGRDGMVRW